ncbi:Chromobox protein 1 [Entomophthora muscae]|uniref:Chromobox protein 1 n=1 Tax=Entomophthora muscae TaxID=34485 RepID=A0ACC2TBQ3_9FUNG|nr:Chromobox protein 1 [Entomophthora muscae]
MTSSQRDPLSYSVFLMTFFCPFCQKDFLFLFSRKSRFTAVPPGCCPQEPNTTGFLPETPEPIVVDGTPEYEMEAVVASRQIRKSLKYCVKWKDYPSYNNSWVSSPNCGNCWDLIQEFHTNNPLALGPPKSLLALKIPKAHKNFSVATLPQGGMQPQERGKNNVNPLSPLALDQKNFPATPIKGPKITAKPLKSQGNLAHTVDKRFVLAYPADLPALVVPS